MFIGYLKSWNGGKFEDEFIKLSLGKKRELFK